jgi:LysR family transcriptional regulator, glycine cleavage system transcriptional activator
MKSRIPPLHTLKALEAIARLGTVRAAADELGVTRSAVSHRLAMLEDIVGFEIVKRFGKGVVLTPRAHRYAQDVHKSLTLLASAQDDESDCAVAGVLRISSTAGFAAMWLCGHIASFNDLYPEVQVDIATGRTLDDISTADVDVFIAFGDGNWPGRSVRHLYDVEFMPLCSPALLAGHALRQPSDLLEFPLLHLRNWDDWSRWLTLHGVDFPPPRAGIRFSDLMLVQTAAIAAQGVMMGDEMTCGGAIAAGRLVAPFTGAIKASGAYYLVSERQKHTSPAVTAFTRWLDALIG